MAKKDLKQGELKRRVSSSQALTVAKKKLPDNETHAWYEIIDGNGTYHPLTGLALSTSDFVYIPRELADMASGIFKLSDSEKTTTNEVK